MPERHHSARHHGPRGRSAHRDAPRAALAELLVTAAAELAAPLPPLPVPDGRPVTLLRVALGRYRDLVAPHGVCAVTVGSAVAAWLGPPDASPPRLPGLVHRDDATPCRVPRTTDDAARRYADWQTPAPWRTRASSDVGCRGLRPTPHTGSTRDGPDCYKVFLKPVRSLLSARQGAAISGRASRRSRRVGAATNRVRRPSRTRCRCAPGAPVLHGRDVLSHGPCSSPSIVKSPVVR